MITYTHYHPSDAHAAVEVWNSTLGEQFPIDLRLWRQNVDDSSYTIPEASLIARDDEADNRVVGLLIIKSPKHIGAIIVAPEYQRQGIGTEMVAMAEQGIGTDTIAKWVVGQDYNHFFPGVPEQASGALSFFEEKLGFTKSTGFANDVRRSLADFEIAPEVQARIASLRDEGIELDSCTERDLSSLIDHISKNFSHRWVADTVARLNVETNPGEIMVARRARTGEIAGFAHTFSTRSRYVGPSIYWRALLGPRYGGLGPMGVDKELRKTGLGLALLSYSVERVKQSGATEMAIDWTELVGFYAKCGFAPWKRYIPMRQT